jgi:hypothetical protein
MLQGWMLQVLNLAHGWMSFGSQQGSVHTLSDQAIESTSKCVNRGMSLANSNNRYLEDKFGVIFQTAQTGHGWTIAASDDGMYFITGQSGKSLEDRNGVLGLSNAKGQLQKWDLSSVRGGYYITSHRNMQLSPKGDVTGFDSNKGQKQQWQIDPKPSCIPTISEGEAKIVHAGVHYFDIAISHGDDDDESNDSVQDTVQVPTAKDTNDYCADWASKGECEKNPGYMLGACPTSCTSAVAKSQVKRRKTMRRPALRKSKCCYPWADDDAGIY